MLVCIYDGIAIVELDMSRGDLCNGPLAGLPPEQQTKLLKKIAQLTKVIYTLHTKSEDQDEIAEALRVKYQEDLGKSSLEYETRTEQFHAKYIREIEKYKGQIKQTDTKLRELNEELKNVENQSAKQKSHYISELALLDNKYTDEFDKLSEYVTESNNRVASVREIEEESRERIQLLEEAQQREIDQIVSKFESESKLLQDKIVSIQSEQATEIRERESMVQSHRDEKDRMVAEHNTALAEAKEEAQGTVDHLLEHMKEEYVREREELHSQISSMSNKISSLERDKQVQDVNSKELQHKLNAADGGSEELRRELRELSQEKNVLEDKLILKEREYDTLEKRNEAAQSLEMEKSTKISDLETMLSALESTMSALQTERDALFTSLSEAREDTEKRSNRSKQNDRATETKMKHLERECSRLNQELVVLNEEMEKAKGRSELSLEQQKGLLENERTRRENEMEEEHREVMKNAERNTQAALMQLHRDLTSTHQFTVEKLVSEKDENIRSLEQSVEALVSAVNDKTREIEVMTGRMKEGETGAVNAAEQVGVLKDKIKQLTNEIREKQDTETKLMRDKLSLEEMCREIEIEARRREQEIISNSKTEVSSSLTELSQKWESKNKDELGNLESSLKQSHATELARYRQEIEEKLKMELERVECEWGDRDKQREHELVGIERDLLAAQQERQQLQSVVREKERMLSREKKEREQSSSISKEEVDRMKEQFERELEAIKQAMNMRSASELSDLRNQHEKELAGVRTGHNVSVNALKDTLNREKLGVLREIETRHRGELEVMKSNNLQSIEQVRRSGEEDMQSKITQRDLELKQVMEEKERVISDLKKETKQMNEVVRTQDNSRVEYKEDISRLHNAIRDMGVSLEQKESELLSARRNSCQQLKQRDLEIRTVHQKDVKILEEKYQIRAKQLAADFTLLRRGLEGKIDELNEELEKADKRYYSREPRSEDLILISELQRSVTQREMELEKMKEESKFYKLELINREQSYNKMFGTKPKIGSVTPIQTKTKQAEGGVSRNSYPSAPTLSSQKSRVVTMSKEGAAVKPARSEQKSKTLSSSQARIQHST